MKGKYYCTCKSISKHNQEQPWKYHETSIGINSECIDCGYSTMYISNDQFVSNGTRNPRKKDEIKTTETCIVLDSYSTSFSYNDLGMDKY